MSYEYEMKTSVSITNIRKVISQSTVEVSLV